MSGYEEELKREIFKKLRELEKVEEERDEIENDPETPSYSEIIEDEDLSNEYFDYLCLCSYVMQLEDEIKMLMFDSQYLLLTAIPISQIKKLNFFVESMNPDDSILQEKLEADLNIRLLKLRDELKERQKKVKPLHLTKTLGMELYRKIGKMGALYNQVITCYFYGAFGASCVLCRAIAELIADRYTNSGKKSERSRKEIWESLEKVSSINKESLDAYSDIGRKANEILHKGREAGENDAYEMIRLLQLFIRKIYNEPELKTKWRRGITT